MTFSSYLIRYFRMFKSTFLYSVKFRLQTFIKQSIERVKKLTRSIDCSNKAIKIKNSISSKVKKLTRLIDCSIKACSRNITEYKHIDLTSRNYLIKYEENVMIFCFLLGKLWLNWALTSQYNSLGPENEWKKPAEF